MGIVRGLAGAIGPALLVAVTGTATGDAQEGLEAYPLDSVSRSVSPKGKVRCPEVDLVRYRGELIRYAGGVRVNRHFRERLRLFEKVVVKVATGVYGRAPRSVAHVGGYKCRRIRRYPGLLSEHGLGNAIDVKGFDFGPAERGAELPEGVPRRLRRSFRVRLLDHWNGKGAVGRRHALFLRTLARKLIARPDIFRVVLGPSWPGHRDHFHLDCASYRVVSVFE
jgi:hypothetical protein